MFNPKRCLSIGASCFPYSDHDQEYASLIQHFSGRVIRGRSGVSFSSQTVTNSGPTLQYLDIFTGVTPNDSYK